jgi:hypothetical protein
VRRPDGVSARNFKNQGVQRMTIALAALLFLGHASAQNLLLNGGFESPGLSRTQAIRYLTNGDTFIPAWTVIDDGIGEKPYYAQGPNSDAISSGSYGLILNQGSGIKTTFRAETSFYELALFLHAGNCKLCVSPAPLRVTINGNSYTLPLAPGWSRQTLQFYTTNSINTLELFNESSPADYKQFGLDDVSITKVKGSLLAFRFYPGVILDGTIGQRYEIQAAPEVGAPFWQTLTNVLLTNSPYIYIEMDPKNPFAEQPKRRIYRAVQVP